MNRRRKELDEFYRDMEAAESQNTTGTLPESHVRKAIECSESVGFIGPPIHLKRTENGMELTAGDNQWVMHFPPKLVPLDVRGEWKPDPEQARVSWEGLILALLVTASVGLIAAGVCGLAYLFTRGK